MEKYQEYFMRKDDISILLKTRRFYIALTEARILLAGQTTCNSIPMGTCTKYRERPAKS
jgi:hypothetical protein